jgi:hypothetical protein
MTKALKLKQQSITMGLSSNLRSSPTKRCKQFAFKRSTTAGKAATNTKQRNLNGELVRRVDQGTMQCIKCEKKRQGVACHKPHHVTCQDSNYYNDGGPTPSARTRDVEKSVKVSIANNTRKLQAHEKGGKDNPTKRAHGDTFFTPLYMPSKQQAVAAAVRPTISTNTATTHDKARQVKQDTYCPLSRAMLKSEINNRIKPNQSSKAAAANVNPPAVEALVEYLLDLVPKRFESDSNTIMATDPRSKARRQLEWYREKFPPGTLDFKVPKANKMETPDRLYEEIEGVTIYLVNWELNYPGIYLKCFNCDGGEMIHDRYDYKKNKTLTPILDVSGQPAFAISMSYKCNNCGSVCKGNDGRLLHELPHRLQMAYPVDRRYAVNKKMHLSKTTTRVMENMMPTYGNGDFLSRSLYKLRTSFYEDREESYYQQCAQTEAECAEALSPLQAWLGTFGLSGQTFRDLYNEAAVSNLTSTGMSDHERHEREIQSVGCKFSTSSDHTFEALKNWTKKGIKNANGLFTMNTETGEVAVAVIVPSLKAEDRAHAAEQFARRKNVCPKVHYSDTWPASERFWKTIFGAYLVCRLGLFSLAA